jgi:hypothetical protein
MAVAPVIDKNGLVIVGSTAIDCSEEAQARRREQIARLEEELLIVSTVSSISDRGRAVSYLTAEDILAVLADLRAKLNFCCFGVLPQQPRLREWRRPFQIKGL